MDAQAGPVPARCRTLLPEGLTYRPDLLSDAEEKALIERMAALPFRPFEFQGFLGKRRTVSFGWSYRFDGSGLVPAEPIRTGC